MTLLGFACSCLLVAAVFARGRHGLLLSRVSTLLLLASSLLASVSALAGAHAALGRFAYDELSALLVPLAAIAASATLLAAPRGELDGRTLRSLLLSLLSCVAALCARDLTLFAVAWTVDLCALGYGLAQPASAPLSSAYRRYALLGTVPLAVALLLIVASGGSARFDGDQAVQLSPAVQHGVFILLAMAASFRSGLLPLHSWLPALPEYAPAPLSALRFAAPFGPVLIARATLPLTPAVATTDLSAFSSWAVLSALYCGVVGLAQRDLRRAVGFVLSSQSALLLFGLCAADSESMHGALLGMLSTGLSATGLVLTAAAFNARLGSSDLERVRGGGRRFALMAALFFLTAAASIGLPGTLAFVSEDLLLHGLLRSNAAGALLLLAVTVMNGITLLRSFFRAFQGPSAGKAERGSDLVLRESLVIGGLLALTFVAGLYPQLLITLQERSVDVLSRRAHPHSDGPAADACAAQPLRPL